MKQVIDHCLTAFFMIISMVILIFLLLIIPTSWAATETVSRDQVLVIGKVTKNPKKHFKTLKPMVDYVVSKMADLGIKESRVLMARNNEQMISYLKQGKIDWVTETPFSALLYQEKAGAEFLLRKWKKGVPEYHSLIFTRKDSGIHTLADLKGKSITFEDPGSTSGYYIPASILIREGFELALLGSPKEKPAHGKIGYVFSGLEVNTAIWVHKGIVDAGAINNLDWDKTDHLNQALKPDLKIVYKTKNYPRALEIVRKDLDSIVRQRLKKILLAAQNDPAAKEVLQSYQKTKKFDELDEKTWAGLKEAKELLQIVRDKLE